ncbi:MAG: DUF1080 domain-containing protein [Phycisphaerae bacterium]|nr:DUF1080 domain-containing protein [Phycisphaerae bacterium]
MTRVVTCITILAIIGLVAATGCEILPPPSPSGDGVYIFDGHTLNGWVQRGGQAHFSVQNGMIVGETVTDTPNSFLCTQREYGDFSLDLEFLVDEGLNSGVQIRSQSLPDYKDGRVHGYQVEIDPSRKPYAGQPKNLLADGRPAPSTEPRAWTGGIYDEARRGWLADLTRNEPARRAFRRAAWNHLRIEAVGDSIRTWINGVPAADIKDNMTPKGFIALQVHSSDVAGLHVRFRNIHIQEIGPALR